MPAPAPAPPGAILPPLPDPTVQPAVVATFSCSELGGTPAMVEMLVRVTIGDRYRETKWNETETPEIARVFSEMEAAKEKLLAPLPGAGQR